MEIDKTWNKERRRATGDTLIKYIPATVASGNPRTANESILEMTVVRQNITEWNNTATVVR